MTARRDPEATRTAILDAAEECFIARGLGETSVSAIARKAKVTKSLIHHHFGSKAKLWEEVKQRRFAEYAERQLEMLEQSEPEAGLLKESLSLYFHFLKANPSLVRMVTWMYLEEDEECIDMNRAVLEGGTEAIRQGQEIGQIRDDVDPRFLLFVFLAIAEHWFQFRNTVCSHLEIDGSPEERDQTYFETMTKIFFEGVLPREPKPEP
ncbi:MAG: TetR family transcriptional regulator [Acidobacteriota bacterium]